MQAAGGAREPPSTAVWLCARDRLGYAGLLSLAAVAPELAQLLRRPDFWAGFRCPQLDLQTSAQAGAFLAVAGDAWSSARVHLNELLLRREGLKALAPRSRSFPGVTVERFLCAEGEPSSPKKYYKIILTAEQLACLADTFPRLLHLDLSGFSEFHGDGLKPLSKLDLVRMTSFGQDGLKPLAELQQLWRLNLAGCHGLYDAGLEALTPLEGLQDLDLSGCDSLAGTGLAHVPKRRLEELSLARCYYMTDAGLEALKGSIELRRLDLTDCQQITDEGLAHLQGLTKLRHLSLAGCLQLTDVGLGHLTKLTNLEHLDLARCLRPSGAGLLGLSHLSGLSYLNLTFWRAGDIRRRKLAHCHETREEVEELFRELRAPEHPG